MKELPGKGHLWLLHNKRTVGTDLSVPASAHPSFLGFLVFAPLSVGAAVMQPPLTTHQFHLLTLRKNTKENILRPTVPAHSLGMRLGTRIEDLSKAQSLPKGLEMFVARGKLLPRTTHPAKYERQPPAGKPGTTFPSEKGARLEQHAWP